MIKTTGAPFDIVAALTFLFGAIVIAVSLGSLALTLLAVIGISL
jgi:hypothetical protein